MEDAAYWVGKRWPDQHLYPVGQDTDGCRNRVTIRETIAISFYRTRVTHITEPV